MPRQTILWIAGLCVAIGVTNRYPDIDEDRALYESAARDAYAYEAIAQSAPALPAEMLAFHHAQRIAIPYVIGMIHRVLPVRLHYLFRITVAVMASTILLVLASILQTFRVPPRCADLVVAILALNPWGFRYYLAFPEYVNDVGFMLGLAILVKGLIDGRNIPVLLGQLLASLARQTGLLLVPLVVLWVLRDRDWQDRNGAKKILLGIAVAAIAGVVYAVTATLAGRMAMPSGNAQIIVGIGSWIAVGFDLRVLAAFLLRVLAAVAIPLGCFLAISRRLTQPDNDSDRVRMLLFGSACICAQPVLAGPGITAGSAERLIVIGLLPAFVALAIKLRDARALTSAGSAPRFAATIALLGLASLHHVAANGRMPFSYLQSSFSVAFAIACVGIFFLLYRDSLDPKGATADE